MHVLFILFILHNCIVRTVENSNSLHSTLRSSQTLNTFLKHIKTHLFQCAFNSP